MGVLQVVQFMLLSIERAAYKQSLFPGSLDCNFRLVLQGIRVTLTDNSGMVKVPTYYGSMRAYQIISGSNGIAYNSGTGNATTSEGYAAVSVVHMVYFYQILEQYY